MNSPKASIVVPAYNQAEFLGEAIQSVLDQTYQNFEIIVVNDASQDFTEGVVNQFTDSRIKYMKHDSNRGLPATRNTGINASSGEFIALLDADDFYLPKKIQTHVEYLMKHPEVGVSYSNRYELNYSSNSIRELWRPPISVSLSDLVLGFPFVPSDLVLRREWLYNVGLFDESYLFYGEDLSMNCRLALSGCVFANIDKALNCRRHHSGKTINDIPGSLKEIFRALDDTFNDPRCPKLVKSLKNLSHSYFLMVWANEAMFQNETILGQTYLKKAVLLNPEILEGKHCELIRYIVQASTADENLNHEEILQIIFNQFPTEMDWIKNQYTWAVSQGYLYKGTRAVMWDRLDDGHLYFARTAELGVEIDDHFIQNLIYQLISYNIEFGEKAVQNKINNLIPYLEIFGNQFSARKLKGEYLFNEAFQSFHSGEFNNVSRYLFQAILNYPRYLFNPGLLSLLLKSIRSSIV